MEFVSFFNRETLETKRETTLCLARPSARCPFSYPFFGWEGFPAKIATGGTREGHHSVLVLFVGKS